MRCPRSSPPITGPCAVLLLVCSSSAIAGPPCDERQSSPGRMPEPVLGESITDIDASKAGELEVDLTASVGHSGGTRVWQGSVEVESRVTNRLGLEIELGHSFASVPEPGLVLRLAASWSLVHLDGIGFHGQAELSARLAGQIEVSPDFPTQQGFGSALTATGIHFGLGLVRRPAKLPALTRYRPGRVPQCFSTSGGGAGVLLGWTALRIGRDPTPSRSRQRSS